jgi:glycosyltransferase involved in cell wall biosynthesis
MFRQLRVAVVIPAFNEERAITAAVATVPSFVDRIVVVDDASHDATSLRAAAAAVDGGPPVEVVRHGGNRGVGAAIVTGYRRAVADGCDAIAVMAGDGQMDPADLPALLAPLADGSADYVKGNRFRHREIWVAMPPARIVGNVLLSVATKVTSGYRHVFDSQCGYTAISAAALAAIDLDEVFPRYGYPNDLLARLHVAGVRVADVPVRPIYGPHWKSGISMKTALGPIPTVLARSWATRIVRETQARLRALSPAGEA